MSVTEEDGNPAPELEIPKHHLIQLLLGYRDIETLLLEDGVTASEEIVPVLGALFPPGEPYMWWPDRF